MMLTDQNSISPGVVDDLVSKSHPAIHRGTLQYDTGVAEQRQHIQG